MGFPLIAALWVLIGSPFPEHADHGIPADDWQRVLDLRLQVRLDEQSTRAGASGGIVLRGGIGLYQLLLSSQDASHCQFHPSCSRFAQDSLARHGTWRGMLMAMDRIQRCSPFARFQYWRDPHTGYLHDPVEAYERSNPTSAMYQGSIDHDNVALEEFSGETGNKAKRPAVAMLLSCILPGSGKLYAGRPLDGLSNLLGTGIPATFAAVNFSRHGFSSARGWFHGTFALGFYAGNIWGSGEAARQANRSRQQAETAGRDVQGERIAPIGRRFPFAMFHPARSMTEHDAPDAAMEDRYESALIAFAEERYNIAAAGFLDVADIAPHSSVGGRARLFQSLAHAECRQWNAARRALELTPETVFPAGGIERVRTLAYLDGLPQRPAVSPRKATYFSAVLPGAGQIYSRHYVKGAASLVVNTLTGYYVYDCYRTESWVELFIAALPLFWRYYRGGMLSAASCARAYNDRIEQARVRGYYEALGFAR